MGKFYAVKEGRKIGIFNSWTTAEEQVKGFPNAKFKSFSTKDEAETYLKVDYLTLKLNKANTYEAYVDGSFNESLKQYGSGVVILKDGKVIEKISLPGNDSRFIESFQIAGEVIASLEAMKWAVKNSLTNISIYYDYQGISSWALKEWKANKKISKYYVEEFDKLKNDVNTSFIKVKGHSGNKYNDVADSLANKAAKINFDKYKKVSLFPENIEINNNIFESILGNKKNIFMNIYINNKMYSSAEIYKIFKNKWKQKEKKLGDIKELKGVFLAREEKIVIQVILKNNEINYIEVGEEQLND